MLKCVCDGEVKNEEEDGGKLRERGGKNLKNESPNLLLLFDQNFHDSLV